MAKQIIAAYIIALLTSCSTAKMAVDNSQWNNTQELSVKGRQGLLIKQKLSFGEYKTISVKRSWTKGSSSFAGWAWGRPGYDDYARIIGIEFSKRKQSVRFELTDATGNESSVFCVTNARNENFVLGKNPNSLFNIATDIFGIGDASENLFWVKIYLKNQEYPWELLLDNEAAQRNSKKYSGIIVQNRDNFYTIHPIYKLNDKNGKTRTMPIGSVGFEIRTKSGKPLAAVSLIDNGVVYMNEASGEEKFLMANICTALLLQQQI